MRDGYTGSGTGNTPPPEPVPSASVEASRLDRIERILKGLGIHESDCAHVADRCKRPNCIVNHRRPVCNCWLSQ